MIKDITKITISGAQFSMPTTFDLFNPHDEDNLKTIKGALLYGRNGTGMSTIATLQFVCNITNDNQSYFIDFKTYT